MSAAFSLRLPLILLPLLTLAHAAFDPNQLQALYRRRVGIDGSPRCPDLFRFTISGREIPPSEIFLDKVRCKGGLLFLHLNPPSRPNSGLVRYFSSDPATGDFYVGDLSHALICGNLRFAPTTIFTFVRPDRDITITWDDVVGTHTVLETETASVFTFRQGVSYIIVNNRCLYTRDDSPPIRIEDRPACFPAHATVDVERRGITHIAHLTTGDRVHVGGGMYSPIFAWTHRDTTVTDAEYISVDVGLDTPLVLTTGHMVYASGRVVKARHIRIGDVMRKGTGGFAVVANVRRVKARGLYNPQTVHGDIVVDGIVVTTYTSAVDRTAAHALLAPVRALFHAFGAVGMAELVAEMVLAWRTS